MAVTIAMLARIPVSLDLPRLRLWAALLTVAAAFAALTTFLRRASRRSLAALVLALLLDQLLRAAGSTWDLSLRPAWWLVQIPLTLVSVWLAWSLAPSPRPGSNPASPIHQPGWLLAALPGDSSLRLAGSLALAGLLFLQLNLLSLPNALARWSGSAYTWLAPALWVASLSGMWQGEELVFRSKKFSRQDVEKVVATLESLIIDSLSWSPDDVDWPLPRSECACGSQPHVVGTPTYGKAHLGADDQIVSRLALEPAPDDLL